MAHWLTLVAMSLALLAPGVSRALSFAQGKVAPWGAVCSAGAEGRPGGAQTPAETAAHLLDACACCTLASDAPLLLPAPPVLNEPPGLRHALPLLFLRSPHPLVAWHAAQPRGPPLSS